MSLRGEFSDRRKLNSTKQSVVSRQMVFKTFAVYILTNKNRTVLYTGVTNDLRRRVSEHKSKLIPGFTKMYNIDILVYFEWFEDAPNAIAREKQIKAGSRSKKIALIDAFNNGWRDLFDSLLV
jgi:putative endonuclease